MNEEKYKLKVVCSNCGHKQDLEIKKGVEFFESGWGIGSHIGDFGDCMAVDCENCGCYKLEKEEVNENGK